MFFLFLAEPQTETGFYNNSIKRIGRKLEEHTDIFIPSQFGDKKFTYSPIFSENEKMSLFEAVYSQSGHMSTQFDVRKLILKSKKKEIFAGDVGEFDKHIAKYQNLEGSKFKKKAKKRFYVVQSVIDGWSVGHLMILARKDVKNFHTVFFRQKNSSKFHI